MSGGAAGQFAVDTDALKAAGEKLDEARRALAHQADEVRVMLSTAQNDGTFGTGEMAELVRKNFIPIAQGNLDRLYGIVKELEKKVEQLKAANLNAMETDADTGNLAQKSSNMASPAGSAGKKS